MLLRIPIH